MYPHQIRLLGPWIAGDGRRVNPPIIIAELGDGPVRLTRRFGAPRQLDDWERVRLVPGEGDCGRATWRLNGAPIQWIEPSAHLPRRADVTTLLQPRNELVVEWEGRDGEFTGALLEIGCRAYVAEVKLAKLDIVVDVETESADDPLELYITIDGESRDYRGPFRAAGPTAHTFQLHEGWSPKETLKIDLVCRSVFWDSVELSVSKEFE